MKTPITIEFTWSEAANLLSVAASADTKGWTPAARGNLKRAIEKLANATLVDDPNAFYLVVRGQTPAPAVNRDRNPLLAEHEEHQSGDYK